MIRVVVLDASPLGLVTRPPSNPVVLQINLWIAQCIQNSVRVIVPEIADYEVRRELVRTGNTAAVARLDAFITALPDRYLPVSTEAWRLAAYLWRRRAVAATPLPTRRRSTAT